MIRRAIGAMVGAELDRQRGQNGIKGAVIGMIAARALTCMGPLGMVIGGAWVAKQALDRRRATRPGGDRAA